MLEFLVAGVPLILFAMAILQLSLLWMGKGVVDTAAHLAARKFARSARLNFSNARQEAFIEAYRACRNRPGTSLSSALLTTLEITHDGERRAERAGAGDALLIRLSHGVELVVPWIDRILYSLSPGRKFRIDGRYYLMLQSDRWVTVE